MSFTVTIPESQLNSTFGCLYLGPILSAILWGAGCLQLYFYYEKYWNTDKLWLRTHVFIAFLCDTAHQILIIVWSYDLFVKGIADPTQLTRLPEFLTHVAVFAAITDVMVEFIFIRRVWYLSDFNRILTGVLSLGALGQFASTLAYYGQILQVDNLAGLSNLTATEKVINCFTFLTDTAVAVTLILLLRKNRSGLRRTDSVISRLVLYTMGVGSITAVVSIVALVTGYAAPETLIYFLIDMVFPKLYFNCMLASLNARSSLRAISDNGVSGGIINSNVENIAFTSVTTTNTPTSSANLFKDSCPKATECRVDLDIVSDRNKGKDLEAGFRIPATVAVRSVD